MSAPHPLRISDNSPTTARISVVTPTLGRPDEVRGLIDNLNQLDLDLHELVLVDGAELSDLRTEAVASELVQTSRTPIRYVRAGGGTAIQRNVGIDASTGDLIAFIDDDIRLEADFFDQILEAFDADPDNSIAGISGCLTNQRLDGDASRRWRWYRRLHLFRVWEPGHFDYHVGYPINRYLQPAHEVVRDVDFISTNSAVWRRIVFDEGLRFDEFFRDFGVLEDAHLALRARQTRRICEAGLAHAVHLDSPSSRENARLIAWKTAVNYRFVFVDIVPVRNLRNEMRFWNVQSIDLLRLIAAFLRRPTRERWEWVVGKFEGIVAASRISSAEDGRRIVSEILDKSSSPMANS